MRRGGGRPQASAARLQAAHHPLDLRPLQPGEDREGQLLLRPGLGLGKPTAGAAERRLPMKRRRVVDAGSDTRRGQRAKAPIAFLDPHREQVVDARALAAFLEVARLWAELRAIRGGNAPTRVVPVLDMPELDSEERRLHSVETLVEPEHDVLALRPLTQVAQLAASTRHLLVIRAH